ncbi:MAG: hypothetical protein ABEJ98_02255 [Candidatus Nanohaloarchaea archaeon]
MRKITMILAALLVMSPLASSALGSFVYDSSKKTQGLEAVYTLGLINTGDEPVEVTLAAEETGNYSVQLPASVSVPAANGSLTPSGAGWYALSGKYYPVKKVDIVFRADEKRVSNSFRIPLTVTTAASGTGGLLFSRVLQSREYTLTADVTEPLPEIGGEETRNRFWREEQEFNTSQEKNVTDVQQPKTVEDAARETRRSRHPRDGGGLNALSYLLIAGTALSALYIWRMI